MTKRKEYTLVLEELEKLTSEKKFTEIKRKLESITGNKAKGDVFELYLAYLYKGQGFYSKVVGGSNDGGADILLSNPETPNKVFRIVQAKNHKVPIKTDHFRADIAKFEEKSSLKYNCNQFLMVSINGFVNEHKRFKYRFGFEDFKFVKELIESFDLDNFQRPKVDLFTHNLESYEKLNKALKTSRKACIVNATGTGKSFIIGRYLWDHVDQDSIVLIPSKIIEDQMYRNFDYALSSTTFITYSALQRMNDDKIKMTKAKHIILDEFHRAGASEWEKGVRRLLKNNPSANIIGTSATPKRYLDGNRDMALEYFDENIASQIDLFEAIARNILPAPKYVTSLYKLDEEIDKLNKQVSESILRAKEKTEYKNKLKEIKVDWEKTSGVPQILQKYLKGERNKFIVFCESRDHLRLIKHDVQKWFIKAFDTDTEPYVVHSKKTENKKDLQEFKDTSDKKKIHLLFCIDMLNEGLHIKDVHGVIFLRKTESPRILFQQMGRCIQTDSNHIPIVFDFVNNFKNVKSNDFQVGMDEAFERENEIRSWLGLKGTSKRMEIVDETIDISEVLEQVRFSTASWNVQYEYLKEFLEVNGGRFPEKKEEFPLGNSLGSWCHQQRCKYKSDEITNDRIYELNSIDFIWDPLLFEWERQYKILLLFLNKNLGRFPEKREQFPKGENLGEWCQSQRTKKHRLSKDQVRKLNALNYSWDPIEERWTLFLNYLKRYLEANYGNFPGRTERYPENEPLGQWCNNQRSSYRNEELSIEKTKLLEKIGFFWNVKEHEWRIQLTYLEKYLINSNGRLPEKKEKYPTGNPLGAWCCRQRVLYNKNELKKSRLAKLDEIGFIWDLEEYEWNRKYEYLREYIKLNNGNFPKTLDKNPDGVELGEWCRTQRKSIKEGKLSKERIKKLNSINFPWSKK